MTKLTRITIETSSVMLLRGTNLPRSYCPLCNAESEMIDVENLQVISNLDTSGLDKWINSEDLHRTEVANGSTQICLNSLLTYVQKTTNI